MVNTQEIAVLEQSILLLTVWMGCAYTPHSHPSESNIFGMSCHQEYLLIPHAEFKSSRLPHLLLYAKYVRILFEYLLQIYKATVVLLPPGYTQSGTEVKKKKKPWHEKENKPRTSYNIISRSFDQLGFLEFFQVDFPKQIQDRTDPHTYPDMIFNCKTVL